MRRKKTSRTSKKSLVQELEATLESALNQTNEALQQNIEVSIGHALNDLFSQIDRVMLEPGFGGLLEVPTESAQKICYVWEQELRKIKPKQQAKTFICRMLDDGSLFLKVVKLPAGVVMVNESVGLEEPKYNNDTLNVDVNNANYSNKLTEDPEKNSTVEESFMGSVEFSNQSTRPTLYLGPSGTIEVKK